MSKTLEETIREQYIDKASRVIDSTHEKLVLTETHNTYPLELFDTYFAPYFFQDEVLPKEVDLFGLWISIAGSPMASVDIVSNNEVVFTVPPLYNTGLINLIKKESVVSKTMDEYTLYADTLPGKTINFIENRLIPAADSVVSSSVSRGTDAWASIAARYKQNIKDQGSSVNTREPEENVTFDDL